jgi:hypothetical protein
MPDWFLALALVPITFLFGFWVGLISGYAKSRRILAEYLERKQRKRSEYERARGEL